MNIITKLLRSIANRRREKKRDKSIYFPVDSLMGGGVKNPIHQQIQQLGKTHVFPFFGQRWLK